MIADDDCHARRAEQLLKVVWRGFNGQRRVHGWHALISVVRSHSQSFLTLIAPGMYSFITMLLWSPARLHVARRLMPLWPPLSVLQGIAFHGRLLQCKDAIVVNNVHVLTSSALQTGMHCCNLRDMPFGIITA